METMDSTRAFVKDVKRVIVKIPGLMCFTDLEADIFVCRSRVLKVGTAVVTRPDGRLAVGRLGALCEQIKELNSQDYEVILVTSGAVGVGRQRLRYRKLIHSSFADLQKPQSELDGKACAAVGQNGLMALYDSLFSQLDVSSAQLLVTDTDFRDPDFRLQLTETVKSLLDLKVIPIFNENDAISTRKAPYEDSSGIFWDNDSLAALLALELGADLLILLSDVEGLYSGPPSDPNSKLIHTYIKEKHLGEITFGDKSRVGRGGMTAKVKAAVYAAYAGIPVVITSGFASNNIIKVLQGDLVGTLFHQDAHLFAQVKDIGARQMAVAARECSRRLQALSSGERSKILLEIANALEANEEQIQTENDADVAVAQQDGYEKSLIARLALKPGKERDCCNLYLFFDSQVKRLADAVRALANMKEPIGDVLKRTQFQYQNGEEWWNKSPSLTSLQMTPLLCAWTYEHVTSLGIEPHQVTPFHRLLYLNSKLSLRSEAYLAAGLVLEKVTSPLGVLLIIFESRPDALVQIASLAIRSGNGLLLKGGKEAKRSNAILHKVITQAIPANVGKKLIGLVTSREEIPELLQLDDVIDLVIPRGSNKLVTQIKASTKIPVLGHADGICHVYVDKSANIDMAKRVVVDAKIDYPAACNAMETLLVHKDLEKNGTLNEIIVELGIKGVTLYGGPRASSSLNLPEAKSFHQEYSSLSCTVEIVDDVKAAIEHIHQHGSAHTDCIIAEDTEVAELFLHQVDSCAVFHNASTRFCDGFRFGLGAEVGVSTSRIHARGPVGVEGLLTTRWILRGNGQIVDGDKGVVYTHKDLPQTA
ncbi:Aspartate/glutamate/uridylate kinase [Dillenia turbinata]|uniref:Delta-1-pyrroline-5-carboxylate synthase n=1 Tax=Dillenia turbinata TaxID=194707 RepID=A0AAN8ZAL7_9MAGN